MESFNNIGFLGKSWPTFERQHSLVGAVLTSLFAIAIVQRKAHIQRTLGIRRPSVCFTAYRNEYQHVVDRISNMLR
jgi:hypothetical protein